MNDVLRVDGHDAQQVVVLRAHANGLDVGLTFLVGTGRLLVVAASAFASYAFPEFPDQPFLDPGSRPSGSLLGRLQPLRMRTLRHGQIPRDRAFRGLIDQVRCDHVTPGSVRIGCLSSNVAFPVGSTGRASYYLIDCYGPNEACLLRLIFLPAPR